MLGHELRNPLAPILTALQLMKLRGDVGAERERDVIERQAHHLVRLVDDLLDISRITGGKVQLKRAPVEISEIVADAIDIASPVLEQQSHRLVTSVPEAGLRVDVDANRVAQVVANLLTNAAKYTPVGGRVEVRASAKGRRVVLTVRDNGAGIAPDLLPRIFDPFVQGAQDRNRPQGGLGLGLAIARGLVDAHGGALRATSGGLGKGSEFTLELPQAGGDGGHVEEKRMQRKPIPRTPRLKVLVVDDNRDAAAVLGDALEAAGYVVRIAHDGPSALELAAVLRPDAALLDIGLPVMDGHELGQRLVELMGEPRPKLIALTGYGQDTDRARSREAGFDEHLVKPIDLDRLQAVVSRLLPNTQPQS
jgi:CheY-like chemotaxis protein/anti-sigma regulatory factor (Ser/Thr protein kinase)